MSSHEINRREALWMGAAIVGGTVLALPFSGCRTTSEAGRTSASMMLPPVHVGRERVIRVVTGLRPYRPSGFVIRPETFDDTLVVHNYGHGGAGVTLSWGSAELAVEYVRESGRRGPVAVLGCGVIGLSTAIRLQETGYRVTIYARDVPPNTTSNAAGASWYPSHLVEDEHRTAAFMKTFERVARQSHRRFQNLVGDEYGVYWRKQYAFADRKMPDPWPMKALPELFPDTRYLPPDTHPFPRPHAYVDSMMYMEMPVYLRALMRDFHRFGGTLIVREFHSVREVVGLSETLVVNCTGLGARDLFGDSELRPSKGQQVVLLPQPEIRYALVFGDHYYMFPRRDGILLGGAPKRKLKSLQPSPDDTKRILAAHRAVFDALG